MTQREWKQEWKLESIPAVIEALRPQWDQLHAIFREPCETRQGNDLVTVLGARFPSSWIAALDLNPQTWGDLAPTLRRKRLDWRGIFFAALVLTLHQHQPFDRPHLPSILVPDFLAGARALLPSGSPTPARAPAVPTPSPAPASVRADNRKAIPTHVRQRVCDYLATRFIQAGGGPTWNCTSLLTAFPLDALGLPHLSAFVDEMNPVLAKQGYCLYLSGLAPSHQLYLQPFKEKSVVRDAPPPAPFTPEKKSDDPPAGEGGPVHITVVDTASKAKQALSVLQAQAVLAVAVEGEWEGTRPDVWLVQVGLVHRPHAYLFDLLSPDHAAMAGAVRTLLEERTITKIFLEARTPRRVLQQALGITVRTLQDIQVLDHLGHQFQAAAGQDGNQKEASSSSSSSSRQAFTRRGLDALLQAHGLPPTPHRQVMKQIGEQPQQSTALWTRRPLEHQVMEYAAHKVLYLGPLARQLEAALHQHTTRLASFLSDQAAATSHASGDQEGPGEGEEQYLWMSADLVMHRQATPLSPEESEAICAYPACLQYTPPNEEDLDVLLFQLPRPFVERVRALMATRPQQPLLEIKLDAGRPPVLLFAGEPEHVLEDERPLPIMPLVRALAEFSGVPSDEAGLASLFTSDHRMGLAGTLHRISCLRSRQGEIIGLTLRIGRHVPHVAELVLDLVARVAREGCNLLLLGAPGMGKTTLLRSVIQALSLHFQQRVIVVDTSNEIAGDSVVPHGSIGHARRMQVPDRRRQHDVLIEAVQNHNPQVIVVDEIGTPQETRAAATIVQRGVAMVGTAHGRDLASLLHNPELDLLVGGHQQLLLGDEEMRLRAKMSGGPKQKIIWQRRMEPIFGQVIEILDWNAYKVYPSTADAVDALLGVKGACQVEYRTRTPEGFRSRFESYPPASSAAAFSPPSPLSASTAFTSSLRI